MTMQLVLAFAWNPAVGIPLFIVGVIVLGLIWPRCICSSACKLRSAVAPAALRCSPNAVCRHCAKRALPMTCYNGP